MKKMISTEILYEQVMCRMDMTKETNEEELQEIIRVVLEEEAEKGIYFLERKDQAEQGIV